jgi:hypothetical protein
VLEDIVVQPDDERKRVAAGVVVVLGGGEDVVLDGGPVGSCRQLTAVGRKLPGGGSAPDAAGARRTSLGCTAP